MQLIEKLAMPEKMLVGTYVLFSLWLILSLLGLFSTLTVIACAFLVIGFLAFHSAGSKKYSQKYIYWLLLIVPFFLIGWAALRGFYTGDAYSYWLPWARELAASGRMPDWLTSINMPYTSAGPLWPLTLGAVFTVLPVSQFSGAFLPILFFFLGLIICVRWLQEKQVGGLWQAVAIVLILFNSQTAFWSWNLLTESMLFLSYALFFYFFEKTWTESNRRNWMSMVGSFCFAVLVKSSGLLLGVPLLLVLFKHRKKISLKIIIGVLVAAAPLGIWFLRNYFVYGNPVFPMFNGMFDGPFATTYALTNPFGFWLERFPTIASRASYILNNVLITFPLVGLSIIGFWKSRFRFPYLVTLVFIVFAGIYIIFSASSGMRYIWPYVSLFAVYAVFGLQETQSRFLRLVTWLLALFSVLSIVPVNSTSDFISSIEHKLVILGDVAQLFYSNIVIVMLVGIIVGYVVVRKKFIWQYSSVLLIATTLLHTRWIGNKSFLNTWSFIIILLAGILLLLAVKQFHNKQKLLIYFGALYLFVMMFVNSYAQAGIYYLRQGVQWPHQHVFAASRDLVPLLTEHVESSDEILTLAGAGYYNWFENKTAIGLNSFQFLQKTGSVYQTGMSQQDVYELLHQGDIDAVVNNAFDFSAYPESEYIVQILKGDSEHYIEYCVDDSNQCLWIIK